MFKIVAFELYELLDIGARLCFVNLYIILRFHTLPKLLLELFSFLHIIKSIEAERVYCYDIIFFNHKNTLADLVG